MSCPGSNEASIGASYLVLVKLLFTLPPFESCRVEMQQILHSLRSADGELSSTTGGSVSQTKALAKQRTIIDLLVLNGPQAIIEIKPPGVIRNGLTSPVPDLVKSFNGASDSREGPECSRHIQVIKQICEYMVTAKGPMVSCPQEI